MAANFSNFEKLCRLITLGVFISSLELFYVGKSEVISSLLLNDFEQKNCITKCKIGLLADVDHLILSGHVTFTDEANIADTMVSLQWRANHESDDRDLFLLMLDDHCNGYEANVNFYCEKTSDSKRFNFYLNMTADIALSDVLMMLTVISGEDQKSSNLVTVPKIYNATASALSINGKSFTGDCSGLNYDTMVPEVLRLCCHDTATPCEVSIHHVGVSLVTGEDCVSYTLPKAGAVDLNFTYVVCSQFQQSKSYVCSFQQGMKVIDTESKKTVYLIVGVIGSVVVVCVIGIVILYCRKIKGQSEKEWVYESSKSKQS